MRPAARIGGFLHRLWRDRAGGSLVETSILMPVFATLVFGVIDLGQLFWTQTALQHAVEMAARCASINTTNCGTTSQIQTYAGTQAYGLTFANNTFTATTPACGNQVTATYTYNFLTALLPVTNISLAAKSCYPK
ncbi:MAG TPA: TadE/TadG family type IV pilus assembly protein [Alphaproteobacteria bacterium]